MLSRAFSVLENKEKKIMQRNNVYFELNHSSASLFSTKPKCLPNLLPFFSSYCDAHSTTHPPFASTKHITSQWKWMTVAPGNMWLMWYGKYSSCIESDTDVNIILMMECACVSMNGEHFRLVSAESFPWKVFQLDTSILMEPTASTMGKLK